MSYFDSVFWITTGALAVSLFLLQQNVRHRNMIFLAASYLLIFLWAKYLFLPLVYVTAVSYGAARLLAQKSRSRIVLAASVLLLLLPLAFYKLAVAWLPELQQIPWLLILPLGISFYTFQAIGYVIDVYRADAPEENVVRYALFLAFFPKFIAGPIERSGNFLQQLRETRPLTVDRFSEGTYLIVWGLVLKLCIAQTAQFYLNRLFVPDPSIVAAHPISAPLALSLYVYADFAGYTNIALGIARILGFDLLENFRMPYFAKNPSDFWRRWHISLSQWVRDYIYFPLGGSRKGPVRTALNLLLIMLIIGIWHGATSTFVLWGLFHGALLVLHRVLRALLQSTPAVIGRIFSSPILTVPLTFALVTLSWILFTSNTVDQFSAIVGILTQAFLAVTPVLRDPSIVPVLLLWAPVLLIDGLQAYAGERFIVPRASRPVQLLFYYGSLYALIFLSLGEHFQFLYARF